MHFYVFECPRKALTLGLNGVRQINLPDDECLCASLCSGSDLINAEGYKQFSNKWICAGFDTANCTLS